MSRRSTAQTRSPGIAPSSPPRSSPTSSTQRARWKLLGDGFGGLLAQIDARSGALDALDGASGKAASKAEIEAATKEVLEWLHGKAAGRMDFRGCGPGSIPCEHRFTRGTFVGEVNGQWSMVNGWRRAIEAVQVCHELWSWKNVWAASQSGSILAAKNSQENKITTKNSQLYYLINYPITFFWVFFWRKTFHNRGWGERLGYPE